MEELSESSPPLKIIPESKLEQIILHITLNLRTSFELSKPSYLIILFIDLLQIFSIIINGNMYEGTDSGITHIRDVLGYFTFNVLVENESVHNGLLIGLICFLVMLWIATLLLCLYGSDIDGISQFEQILSNILGFIIILFKTILTIPFLFIVFQVIKQPSTSFIIMAGLSLFLSLPIFMYSIFILNSYNPFNKLLFSGESCTSQIITLLLKLILVLYEILDTNRILEIFIMVLVLLWGVSFWVYGHFWVLGEFNGVIRKFRIWSRLILVCFVFFGLVSSYFIGDSKIYTYFLMIGLSLYPFVIYMESLKNSSMLHENFLKLTSPIKISTHILQIISLIDSCHKKHSRILLEGYLFFHIRNCNLPNTTCTCREVAHHNCTELETLKDVYFDFVANLLKGSLNRVEETSRIYVLLGFVYQYRLNNKFQAVHSLIKSIAGGGNLMDRIEYREQIKLVELEIASDESKKNANLAVDMVRFLKFNLKIVEFEKELERCTNNHIDFWSEIIEENLNIQKLEKCGAIIAKERESVKENFHEMQELNSGNAHIMILYGQFLVWVCNEDFKNLKLIEKGETIFKNLRESSKINGKNEKYSENSKASIIVISGNEKQLGKIVQTNNFVYESLGYHRHELISQNISSIMPKIFADTHDATLQRFLSTSKDRYNGVERLVPVLCKDGFITPILALTKPLPNLEEGVQIVGFLSNFEPVHEDELFDEKIAYMLYECETEIVMGISKNCFTDYGISKCLVYGDAENFVNELKMKHIFGSNFERTEGGLSNGNEILTTINSKNLKDEFIITNNWHTEKFIEGSSDEDLEEENSLEKEVILRSVLELTYHGTHLRIISITKEQKEEPSETRKEKEFQEILKEDRSDTKSETDELKGLKDFKNFISVKREPTAIFFIKWACIILILIFVSGVVCFILFNESKFENFYLVETGSSLAFLRRMYLAEIDYKVMKVFIQNNEYFAVGNSSAFGGSEINSIYEIIEKQKESALSLLPLKNKLSVESFKIRNFDFFINGSYQTINKPIDEAITIQIAKIGNIADTKGVYLKENPLNFKSLTVTNYFETQLTHTFSLISACDQVQQQILQKARSSKVEIEKFMIVVMAVLIVFSLLWFLVSLPKTLQVMDINSKVLSLFKLISPVDVQEVIKKCWIFQKKYLVEAKVENKKLEGIGEENSSNIKKLRYFNPSRNSPQNSPVGSLNASFADMSSRDFVFDIKEKVHKNTADSLTFQSLEKTINNGNADKKKAIGTFTTILIFFIAYAGTIPGYLLTNYNTIFNEVEVINVLYNRTAQFEEIKSTYVKLLIDNYKMEFEGVGLASINLGLINKIYDTERDLLVKIESSKFENEINDVNTKNLCLNVNQYEEFGLWGDTKLNQSSCLSVSKGILTRGIKTTIVTILEEIRARIQQANSSPQTDEIIETINAYSELENFITRPLLSLIKQILEECNKSSWNINLTFQLINAFFLLAVAVFWQLIWRKYLLYLNESVWRTKSMLNIIPTKIITNNEVLMNEFTSGQLEKVVK